MFRHGSKVPIVPIAAALAILTGCARGEAVAPDGAAADFAALAADFAAAPANSAALQDHARGMAHGVAHPDHAAAMAEGPTHHEHVQHGEHVQRGHMGRHPAGHTALGAEDRPPQ